MKPMDSKKITPQTMAALLAGLALVVLVLVNVCASMASSRFGLRLDMTSNQLYQLSGQSREILDALPESVTLRVFSAESDFLPLMQEVLREYEQDGQGKIHVEYIDPYTHPTVVDAYLQRGLAVELGSIIAESSRSAKTLKLEDMFEMDSEGTTVTGLKCEQQITGAIQYVTAGNDLQIAVTAGHNETISDGFVDLLTQNNYTVSNVTLSMSEIPEDTDMVILAAPTTDFSQEEIRRLDQYLAGGGRLMAFMGPTSAEIPNLKAFLGEWGIGLTDCVVAEALQYTDSNPLSIVPVYSGHTINQYFTNNQLYLILPSTRALEQLYASQGGIQTQKLLYSTDRSYDAQDPEGKTGPFVLAMTAEKQTADGKTRMVVFGSRGIYSDSLLQSDSCANAKLLAQAIGWCTETESALSIPTKSLGEAPISLTTGRVLILALLFVLVLPIGVLAYGFFTYRRRRVS